MVKINLDVADDSQKTFTPLAEGEYKVTVEKCEEDVTKNGNPVFNFTLALENGRKVFDNLIFTPKTANRVKKVNSCFGLATSGDVEIAPTDYIGKSCIVKLFIEDYPAKDGTTKQKNTVDWWNSKAIETKKEAMPF